ncbi:MAG: SpoIID/LytB domain-containing protein [Clostridia bacterium]|nr:SpoIID/LytB domain-containing protein [Clostridia bacterium]
MLKNNKIALFAAAVLTATVILLVDCTIASAAEPNIRVGLDRGKTVATFKSYKGVFEIADGATGEAAAYLTEGDTCTVIKEEDSIRIMSGSVNSIYGGPIIVRPVDGNKSCIFSYNNTQYRGSLVIYNDANGLIMVNSLPLEQYLYGVVGKEMGYSAPQEALKAQSLISRSYAYSRLGSGSYYDVDTTQATQVYGGYSAEILFGGERVKAAVDATKGEVICYNGAVIEAYFHSNAGGYTENSENVWESARPYLKAVPSPYDEYALRISQSSTGWPGSSYQWTKVLTREEVESLLAKKSIDIGTLMNIKISRLDRSGKKETVSGRVTELTFIGTKGSRSFYRDNIRSVLGLQSTLFNIEFDSGIVILDPQGKREVNSMKGLYIIDGNKQITPVDYSETDLYYVAGKDTVRSVSDEFEEIKISGKGYGHGVGLSQWGAQGMAAEKGADYREIIKHYYTGVDIVRKY